MATICDQLESLKNSNEASKPKNIPPKPTDKAMLDVWTSLYGEKDDKGYRATCVVVAKSTNLAEPVVTMYFKDVKEREKFKNKQFKFGVVLYSSKELDVGGIPALEIDFRNDAPFVEWFMIALGSMALGVTPMWTWIK